MITLHFPFNLHSVNNSGFYSSYMNMVEQKNPYILDPDCLGTDKIRRYTNNMKEKYKSLWRHIQRNKNFIKSLQMNTLHPIIYTR